MLAGIGKALIRALAQTAKLAAFGLVAGVVASAIGGLAAAIANLIPLIAELVNALVAASGALLLIPGAIAGIIAVVATLKLGFKGLGDAMKAVASGDAAALNEALKKLAPNARAVVRELARIKPAFDRMRLRIQNALFADLAKRIRELGRLLLPLLNRELVDIARVLNRIFRDVLDFVTSRATRLDLSAIFNATARSAENLRRGLVPILSILRDIAVVGAQVIASLTQGFGRALEGWAADIARLRESGGLEQIIRDGLEAGKALLLLLGDLVGIIRSLVRAAGGAGGLFSFFDRLNRLLQSVEGQRVMRELFNDLDRIGRALIPVLLALLKALLPVVDGIAKIAEAFSPSLSILLLALGNALALLAGPIADLAPLMNALARGLAPIAVILGELVRAATPGLTAFLEALVDGLIALVPVAPIVGRALGDLLAALAPLLQVLGPELALLLTMLATGLSAVARLLTPVIRLVAQGLGEAFSRLLPPLLEVAQQLLPLFAEQGVRIAQAFAPLMPILAKLVETYLTELAAHLPRVIPLLGRLISLFGDWAEVVGPALLDMLEELLPHMPELIRAALDLSLAILDIIVALTPLIVMLARFMAELLEISRETGMFNLAIRILVGTLQFVAGFINFVAVAIRKLIDWLAGARRATSSFGEAIGNMARSAVAIFSNLGVRIRNAVGNLRGLLFGAGKSVIQGLIDGIRAAMPGIVNAIQKAAALVRDHMPHSPAKMGPLSGRGDMRFAGQNIVDRLVQGVNERLAQARAAAGGLAGAFAGVGGPGLAMAGGMPGGTAGQGRVGPATFGPYLLELDGEVVARFAINAVTGAPERVAAAVDEGRRVRGFLNPGRARR